MNNDALLHLNYSAAIVASSWPEVLAALGARFGATASALFDQRFVNDGQPVGMKACVGYSDEAVADFAAYFHHRDLRVRRTLPTARTGHVVLDDRDIPFKELAVTEIQNDFYRPNNVGHISGIVIAKRPDQFSVLSVHRSLRVDGNRNATGHAGLVSLQVCDNYTWPPTAGYATGGGAANTVISVLSMIHAAGQIDDTVTTNTALLLEGDQRPRTAGSVVAARRDGGVVDGQASRSAADLCLVSLNASRNRTHTGLAH
jgi:hypothetical protein